MLKQPAIWLFALLGLMACNDKPSVEPNPKLVVYPNPTTGALAVMLNNTGDQLKKLHVYDTGGKQIQEKDLSGFAPGQNQIYLDIHDSPPGYFFVILETVTGNETVKVLKQ